jgi:hypothetical protein
MMRARTSMAAALCSSCRISQGDVSSRRRSKRFRFLGNGALLVGRRFPVLAVESREAAEESVYDGARVKQVFERTKERAIPRRLWENGYISPLRRDHGLAAIRQDEDEIPSIFAADRLPNGEGLALKRMTGASYGNSFGKVLMMGSVWWFPSIVFHTPNL